MRRHALQLDTILDLYPRGQLIEEPSKKSFDSLCTCKRINQVRCEQQSFAKANVGSKEPQSSLLVSCAMPAIRMQCVSAYQGASQHASCSSCYKPSQYSILRLVCLGEADMPLLRELLVCPEIDSGVWQAVQHSDAIALPEGTHTLTLNDLVDCLLQCGLVDVASGGLQAFNLCSTAGREMHSSRCGRVC